jgi:hypothetical protein
MGYEAILRDLELVPRHPFTVNTENVGNAVLLEHREPFPGPASEVDDALGLDEADHVRDQPSCGLEGHIPMVIVPGRVVRTRLGHAHYPALTCSMPTPSTKVSGIHCHHLFYPFSFQAGFRTCFTFPNRAVLRQAQHLAASCQGTLELTGRGGHCSSPGNHHGPRCMGSVPPFRLCPATATSVEFAPRGYGMAASSSRECKDMARQ